jgi:hypothetical protein
MEKLKDFLEAEYKEKLSELEKEDYKKKLSDFMEILIEIDKRRLN